MIMNKIICGSACDVLKTMPDNLVDCVITSPPYWGLRAYGTNPQIWDGKPECQHNWGDENIIKTDLQAGNPEFQREWREKASGQSSTNTCSLCSAWRGELGLEPTFDLYISHLIQIFNEVKRVLKPTGTCWVNLGDSYSGSGRGPTGHNGIGSQETRQGFNSPKVIIPDGMSAKSLCCIPDRFKIAMVDNGWICRNELIWFKRNCMPSSASDRFTVDFEKMFFFTKQGKYWFEQQFEPHQECSIKARAAKLNQTTDPGASMSAVNVQLGDKPRGDRFIPPQGRNMRCVWDITTQPFKEAHFAVFPPELPERCIKAGCPKEVCPKCGKGRGKTYQVISWGFTRGEQTWRKNTPDKTGRPQQDISGGYSPKRELVGYNDCHCNAGFEPGIALDPFMGSGTTAVVAKKLGRRWLGIELNEKYIEMAEKRIAETAIQAEMEL